ncbi:MAG: DNA polymerase III subunit delta' [Alphaproteobacteria bacterium]|nr:DNA polymerase III subunit delta' [Alphaproteobacteria bacterium]
MSELTAIVGHDAVLHRLRDALARDRLHHALLLEGPQGVGKHTVARWLALAGTCERFDPARGPCGACPTCSRVLAGVHPDVIAVGPDPDKATPTIPVARIREVVRAAAFHRYGAARRFVVVDPAEAMGPAAANALLKTLEEPPEGTHFVLVATHVTALLPTIVSRCQLFRLTPVDEAELTAWLTSRGLDDAARLARLSGGCPGHALSLADGGLDARKDLRDQVLGALAGDLQGIFDLSEALTKGRRQDWTPRVEAVLGLLEELLRDTVVVAAAPQSGLLHDDLAGPLAHWATALWPSGVTTCQRALHEARRDLDLNVTGKTALDALLTRVATELGAARKATAPSPA